MKFTNFYDHPTDQNYRIFHYFEPEKADYFEELLKKEGIKYIRESEVNSAGNTCHLFGIRREFYAEARKLNYLVWARYRRPMIDNAFLRYALIIIVFGMVGIAIWRYIVSY